VTRADINITGKENARTGEEERKRRMRGRKKEKKKNIEAGVPLSLEISGNTPNTKSWIQNTWTHM
jgi:hypothetical protein